MTSARPSNHSVLNYYLFDVWYEIGDSRSSHVPIIAGPPWPVILIITTYLYFVLSWGPRYMSQRPAFDLRALIRLHNVLLILISAVNFIIILMSTRAGWDSLGCDMGTTPLGIFAGFVYFVTKFIDLGDTVFFVLRKKRSQITLLHVFHHAVMPMGCWLGLKFVPVRAASLFPLINTFVHIVMYTYYFLSSYGNQSLWWKKYLTIMQLVQFLVCIFQAILLLQPGCPFPTVFSVFLIVHAFYFLISFKAFYKRSYKNVSK